MLHDVIIDQGNQFPETVYLQYFFNYAISPPRFHTDCTIEIGIVFNEIYLQVSVKVSAYNGLYAMEFSVW